MIGHRGRSSLLVVTLAGVAITAGVALTHDRHTGDQKTRRSTVKLVRPDVVRISWQLVEEGWTLTRNGRLVAARNPYTIRDGRSGAMTALSVMVANGDGTGWLA